ncbi:hypothetical protein QFC22_003024 [Naganishia vaughanmartiniae]|uniref:Uncharacterized protein n=1 Tax=Naganishia vaughanmartiniae TaxID=1424756 RepID=A0ACC2X915_9TREE|nr:hypothetical protein QFC22_003024 [Naganishia vaughanmartiniae]
MLEMLHSRGSSTSSLNFLGGISEDALPSRPSTTPESEIKIHVDGLDVPLKLAVDAGPGCGGITWPSGEVLTKYMAWRHSNDVNYLKNRTVLELGSGTGLVGLAVGLLEPSAKVYITDQKVLLDLMQRNVDLNFHQHVGPETNGESSACPVQVAELDWGGELPSGIPQEPDLILAADCVYFEADARFFKMLAKHFSSSQVDDDRPGEREKYEREGVKLLRLVRTK